MTEKVLTIACPDRVGVVYAVTGFLADRDCNILDSQQFGDPETHRFFMRVHFDAPATFRAAEFTVLAIGFDMEWQLHDSARQLPTLVLVSRFGHCLNDLLYRSKLGALPIDIRAVVSNHRDFEQLALSYDRPFHHLPVGDANRDEQEQALADLIRDEGIELVVLARYMQVLSESLCRELSGRIINIHHSFLPSFKGARPYQQAYDRGVKLIGATAHYVTSDLDDGPIIDQEVSRVDHSQSPAKLEAIGRDLESLALARAVAAHAEHRVLLNGAKTVVFR